MEKNSNVQNLSREERTKKRLRRERQLKMRRRRAFFSLVLMGIICFGIISFASTCNIGSNRELDKILEKYKPVTVYILKGDTSWSIQRRLTPNEDVRKLLYYLEDINGRSMGDIRPGEVLIFFEPIN